MAEDQRRPETKRGGALPALLMLLFIGYPLSTGPVVLLIELGWLGPDKTFWVWFYQPLGVLTSHFPVMETLFNVYMSLWIQLAR